MTLGNEDNPVVVIREQESEVQGEAWIEYDEVVTYEYSGHILRDLASTRVWSQGDLHLDQS